MIRVLDFLLSLVGFVALLPIATSICIAIWLIDKNSPIHMQVRVGRRQRHFYIFKFKTMRDSEGSGIDHASRHSHRITKMGSFLRKSHLDEIPQLINVMNGTMSLVGPRPYYVTHDHAHRETTVAYEQRYGVLPGITGLAQIYGLHGPIDNELKLKQRIRFDNFWVRNRSTSLYLLILFVTLKQKTAWKANDR
jgi:putative colanic acid biosynthesis UDP-glucose lipid carrier transferase